MIDSTVHQSQVPLFLGAFSEALQDVNARWQKARLAALDKALSKDRGVDEFGQKDELLEESQKLLLLTDEQYEFGLKTVYDFSRSLGLSASRYFKIQFEIQDFKQLFSSSGIPCAQGRWSERTAAWVVERDDCPFGNPSGTRMCNWYREAMDGLVIGLGDTERFVRHRSQAYGDEGCLDILYIDSPISDPLSQGFRHGPIPAPMQPHLSKLVSDVAEDGFKLEWLGYSAGILFYKLSLIDSTLPVCQSKSSQAQIRIDRDLHNIFPTLKLQDASPIAVYGEGKSRG